MEGRLSNMQNCVAILQSPEKFMDGFFLGHTPDWKGGVAVAVVGELVEPPGNGGESRNPGKRVTIWHEGRF